MDAFGDRLAWAMKQREVSGRELARRIGAAEHRISTLLNTIHAPLEQTIAPIADALGFPVEAFLDGVRTKHVKRPDAPWLEAAAGRPPATPKSRKRAG